MSTEQRDAGAAAPSIVRVYDREAHAFVSLSKLPEGGGHMAEGGGHLEYISADCVPQPHMQKCTCTHFVRLCALFCALGENLWLRCRMPTTARLELAAAVAAGTVVPKPRGKAPKAYPLWDAQRGVWTNEAGDVQPSKKRAVAAVLEDGAAARSTTAPLDDSASAASAAACSTTAHVTAPPESPMACAGTSDGPIQQPHSRGMQRFLRNPWRDEVPLLLTTPIAEPVSNWCAHLESMGLSAGGFKATYEEGKWEEQSGRYRRHSV